MKGAEMETNFDFKDLFVFDMANNHQGSVDHGLAVIRGVGAAAQKHEVRGALKFQFRQLASFIHPFQRDNKDNKHVSRFLSTELSREAFERLVDEVRAQGLLAMCTPFDEDSVDVICDIGFDIIKVASCSAKDWPLLYKIAESGLPVVFSTGGLATGDIDSLASFFTHRGSDFAIMHCVSLYPIPDEHFQLNQIDALQRRYPGRVIGWSTHENPDDTVPVTIAVAKGARMFERHVGCETDEIKLNAYSSTPEQLDRWLAAYRQAQLLCGAQKRPPAPTAEVAALNDLRRGVFAKKTIRAGQKLSRDTVYFAMPFVEGQIDSGQWSDEMITRVEVEPDMPILADKVNREEDSEATIIKHAVHDIKAMLNEAQIHLNSSFTVEYSHHYGIAKFREVGAVLIDCVNRQYCKKIIVQLPGQYHPSHFHSLKEETFQVLHGVVEMEVDGHRQTLKPGETMLVQPGVWHSFWTDTGAIVEEISTTHHNNDSTYKDRAINRRTRAERKTIVDHWGRFQI